MAEENLISVVFKDQINTKDFTDTYGEEGIKYVNQFIKDNSHILKSFKENEAINFISEKLGGNIDLAKSLFNIFIENKLKETMIENLKEEVIEQKEEIKIYKNHVDLENKKLSKAIDALYNKRIVSKREKVKLRMP